MKENLTEIVCILDRSGSMHGLEKDTVGGCNGLLERQRKEEGKALFSLVLFSDEAEVLYDRVPLEEVRPLTEKEYRTGGCTAHDPPGQRKIRLGIHFPWREYRRRGGSGTIWSAERARGQLLLR